MFWASLFFYLHKCSQSKISKKFQTCQVISIFIIYVWLVLKGQQIIRWFANPSLKSFFCIVECILNHQKLKMTFSSSIVDLWHCNVHPLSFMCFFQPGSGAHWEKPKFTRIRKSWLSFFSWFKSFNFVSFRL